MLKRLAVVFLVFLFSGVVFADSYSIRVANAEEMTVSDNIVTLSGDVLLDFKSDGTERSLSADTVVVFLDNKILQATGNVVLKEGSDKSFNGESLVLDWDSLDIVVFYGTGASDRKSSDNKTVNFYSTGRTISYEGSENVVFFTDGTIATKSNEPYWSVSARKIALLDSDIFFEGATIRMGRVPVLWVPFFFYTGTRLAFNPAIGLSSSKGMFINTTTELYGLYPTSVTVNPDNPSSVLSFLRSTESGELVRDGILYRNVEKAELSDLESWARKTGSYFAFTADAYRNSGVALGFITRNVLLDKALTINAHAVLAYRSEIRYAFDLTGEYSKGKTSVKFSVPYSKDPSVRSDYYQRNTVFGIDGALGVEQTLGKSFSASNPQTMSLDASTSFNLGNFSFSLSSLKTQIDWKWNSAEKAYRVQSAQLPYLKLTSKGTVFDLKGKESTEKVILEYEDEIAREFADELISVGTSAEGESFDLSPEGFTLMSAPNLDNSRTIYHKGGYLNLAYTFEQSLKSMYKEQFERDDFAANAKASITLKGGLPENLFNVTTSVLPDYSYILDEEGNTTFSSKVKSELSATQPFLGLTYTLKANLVDYSKKNSVETVKTAQWSKDYITAHSIKISRTVLHTTLSVEDVLPPLEHSVIPGFSFSSGGITLAGSLPVYPDRENILDGSTAKLDLTVKKAVWSFSVNNRYAFPSAGWDSFSLTQKAGLKIGKFSVNQSSEFTGMFKFKALSFSAGYADNSASINFKGEELKPDRLRVKIKQTVLPLYTWKNRIGFEGTFEADFLYDFQNKYSASLVTALKFNFAVSEFLDLAVSVSSVNNGFYKYYDSDDKFSFKMMWEDFLRSLDIFGGGNRQTSFTLNAVKISLVHYMSDWNLYLDAKAGLKSDRNGKSVWTPEVSIYIQWNEIPELKVLWEKEKN